MFLLIPEGNQAPVDYSKILSLIHPLLTFPPSYLTFHYSFTSWFHLQDRPHALKSLQYLLWGGLKLKEMVPGLVLEGWPSRMGLQNLFAPWSGSNKNLTAGLSGGCDKPWHAGFTKTLVYDCLGWGTGAGCGLGNSYSSWKTRGNGNY